MKQVCALKWLRWSVALCALSSVGLVAASSANASSSGVMAYQAKHAGGTLHLVATGAGGTLDPQIDYTLQYWQLYQATYDGLVTFEKVGGTSSFNVVPDLATAMPKVTNGGKTYAFTLRKGIKFSSGQTVTVKDVQATFQRLFKVSSPNAGSWYKDIVGGPACVTTPATCTLSGGVVVNAATNSVVFNLISPNAEFLDQLAVPFGS
ncbi:MAG TPA: ABC transporter substrate-binding protein, partial [Acidimicrobiales bacterium]